MSARSQYTAQEAVTRYLQRLAALQAQPPAAPGLPTGFATLDRQLGGLPPESLIVVAGYTGHGKTALVMQWVWEAARYLQAQARETGEEPPAILVFNGEMSARQLIAREVARQTGIVTLRQWSGALTAAEWEQVRAAAWELAGLHVYLVDTAGLNLELVEAAAQATPACALLVVDHLQLAVAPGRPPYQGATEAIHRLRRLRDQLQGPLVVLSQLRRPGAGAEERPPSLTDLRDSGAIEENANLVLLLHTPAVRAGAPPGGTLAWVPARLQVAKNRDGWCGTIPLQFWPERLAFRELEEAQGPSANGRGHAEAAPARLAPYEVQEEIPW